MRADQAVEPAGAGAGLGVSSSSPALPPSLHPASLGLSGEQSGVLAELVGTDQAVEPAGAGAGLGVSSVSPALSLSLHPASLGLPGEQRQVLAELVGEDQAEEPPIVVSVVALGQNGGLRAARLQLGPGGVVRPLAPHPLVHSESSASVVGSLDTIMDMFRPGRAAGILGRLFGALHSGGIATQPLPGPGAANHLSADVRMGENPAALATYSLRGMRDGQDTLVGQHLGQANWQRICLLTRAARDHQYEGDWAAALASWQSAARLLQVDSEGLWGQQQLRVKLQSRLHTICAGVARSLLYLGRVTELASWNLEADQLGLRGAAAWGAMAGGLVLSHQGRYIEAYQVLAAAGRRYAGVEGGPNMSLHLAAQALHRELGVLQPDMETVEEEEAQRDMRAGKARSACSVGGLLPPDQPYPRCPECHAPTAMGPGARHVCDVVERVAYGARVWGDALVPVGDLAASLHSCSIGGLCGFDLEGREVLACGGASQCLVCKDCRDKWERERRLGERGSNRGLCAVCRYRTADGSSAYRPLQGTLLRMVELAGRVAGLNKLE